MTSSRLMPNRAGPAALRSVIGLVVLMSGCATSRDAGGDARSAPLPVYHVGDSFTYDENGDEETIFVTEVEPDRIGWADNKGAHWSTSLDPGLPPRSEILKRGQLPLVRIFSPSGVSLFPLQPGKRIEYMVETTLPGEKLATREPQSCEAYPPQPLTVEAGRFDAWKIVCQRSGQRETLYYAPAIGAIVLKENDSRLVTQRKTLVAYHKAGSTSATAGAAPDAPPVDEVMTSNAAESMAAPARTPVPTNPVPPAAAPDSTASLSGYVVQLAAYHSYGEAGRGWEGMKSRMPTLFHGLSPRVESFDAANGASYVRLFVGPFADETAARQLCERLHAQGQACWPRRLP